MQNKLVKQGYELAARKYLAEREQLRSAKYVQKFLKLLPKNSRVLDLGCGAGAHVDDIILRAGHNVIGIDLSEEMIRMARKSCPGGEYLVRDIENLREGEYSVEGVVSFYALFHIPRNRHGRMLNIINSFLPKGAPILITMGDREFEGTTNFYGQPMWWSQWGVTKNRELVIKSGFEIIIDEVDHSGSENHQVLLATKK